ncbi:MAG: hypothetical protein M1816_004440 [Peltula sp. TS41687]|nr:MAG: hypothetical protein M1816_004440 [Peltula sp. TS41687]
MSPPRRRSARLRAIESPEKSRNFNADKLSSVIERDESSNNGVVQSNLDMIISSPTGPRKATTGISSHGEVANIKTPTTNGRLYPSLEEMHPSKVQQSTTKQPDSALRLGFVDIGAYTEPNRFKAGIGSIGQDTPSRPKVVNAKPPSSPGFEFKFTRRGTELGPEAQKMMDDLREEALRIKTKLAVEREEAQMRDGASEEDNVFRDTAAGRKIAKPKGKVGRFSEVHMAEFKKMDSIAGHPSAYRLQQSAAVQPVKTTSLKRSKSQAKLDEPDHPVNSTTPMRKTQQTGFDIKSTVKRMKQHMEDDTSSARPIVLENPNANGGSETSTGLPSVVTTPTKASLARSASVKHPSKTMIPSISRSPSTRTPGAAGLRSEGSNRHLASLGNLSRMKSILRRPRLFSTAITEEKFNSKTDMMPKVTTPTPKTRKMDSNLDKELPSLPPSAGEHRQHHQTPSPVKRVNFTPNTKTAAEARSPTTSLATIPTPIKTLIQQSPSKSSLPASALKYPNLPQIPQANQSPIRGRFHFTFTSLSPSKGPIKFSNTTTTAGGPTTPTTAASTTTPNRPSNSSTIRYVRPSIFGMQNNNNITTSVPDVSSGVIPHGMPNKRKRHHNETSSVVGEAGNSDEENREPKAKRQHLDDSKEKKKPDQMPSRIPSTAAMVQRAGGLEGRKHGNRKRSVLSAARLNVLARPKQR